MIINYLKEIKNNAHGEDTHWAWPPWVIPQLMKKKVSDVCAGHGRRKPAQFLHWWLHRRRLQKKTLPTIDYICPQPTWLSKIKEPSYTVITNWLKGQWYSTYFRAWPIVPCVKASWKRCRLHALQKENKWKKAVPLPLLTPMSSGRTVWLPKWSHFLENHKALREPSGWRAGVRPAHAVSQEAGIVGTSYLLNGIPEWSLWGADCRHQPPSPALLG